MRPPTIRPLRTGLASDGERQDLGSQTAETITGTGSEAGSESTDTVRASESGMDVVASAEATYELVFVDDSVADYEQLVSEILSAENLDRRLDIIFLTADRDGIEQVSEALAGYDNLDAIHFISHGADGAVKLGSTWLTNDNLAGYAGQIAGWADALTTDADLLFYGCDLAAHVEGQQLVAALSALTDADVAASTDDTGDAQLGGNWTLEYAHGAITATTVLTAETGAEWHALLNAFIVTNTNDVGTGRCVRRSSMPTHCRVRTRLRSILLGLGRTRSRRPGRSRCRRSLTRSSSTATRSRAHRSIPFPPATTRCF